ncbi:MAG: hypothetical protein K6L73_04530 [Cellvibrionaceae bacterium]
MYKNTLLTLLKLFLLCFSVFALVSCGTQQPKPQQKTENRDGKIYSPKKSKANKDARVHILTAEEKRRQKQLAEERRLDRARKDSLRELLAGSWRQVRPTVLDRKQVKYRHCEPAFNELKNAYGYELFESSDFTESEYQAWLRRYELQSAMKGNHHSSQRYKAYWGGRELDILEGRLDVKDWLADLLPGGGKNKRRYLGFIAFDKKTLKTIGGAGRFSAIPNENLEMRLFRYADTLYVLRLFHKKKGTELAITPLIRSVQKQKESCRWFRAL